MACWCRAGAVAQPGHPSGHLRLTAPVYYGETVIAPLLLRYLAHHPAVSAELNLDNRKVDLVAENFDLGIRLGPMDGSSLMLRELAVRVHHVLRLAGLSGSPRRAADAGRAAPARLSGGHGGKLAFSG